MKVFDTFTFGCFRRPTLKRRKNLRKYLYHMKLLRRLYVNGDLDRRYYSVHVEWLGQELLDWPVPRVWSGFMGLKKITPKQRGWDARALRHIRNEFIRGCTVLKISSKVNHESLQT